MNCFQHPTEPAVATCSQCNKGVCHQCATDIGRATLCYRCATRTQAEARESRQHDQRNAEAGRLTEVHLAQRRITRAWVIGGVFGIIFGPIAGLALSSDASTFHTIRAVVLVPLMAAIYFYIGWCFSWSIPVVWAWCRKLVANLGCGVYGGCAFWVVLLSILIAIPFTVAYLYGIFGGAIYQYRKARRLIQSANAA